MKRFSIRRVPRKGRASQAGQVTILASPSEKQALQSFALMQSAKGWHTMAEGCGLEWQGKSALSLDAKWYPDDNKDTNQRMWRLTMQYRNLQKTTFLAWLVR